MRIAIRLLLILLSALIAAPAQEQTEARKLLKKVSDAYRSLNSYHFECLTVTESRSEWAGLRSDSRTEQVMVLAAAKPNKNRAELRTATNGLLTIADGETNWAYLAGYNQYSRQAADKLPRPFKEWAMRSMYLLSMHNGLDTRISEAQILREESINVGGEMITCIVVECKYRTSGSNIEPPSDFLWIDKARYLILHEIRHYTESTIQGSVHTSKVTYTYNVVKTNQPLPETLFAFSPPPGSREVADLSVRPGTSTPPMSTGATIGKEAFDFVLKDLSGREVSLKNLRGKVVLINFWASWCGPCRVEMPYLEKLHREFKDKEVVILGINSERPEVALEFFQKNGYTFSTLWDERGSVARNYQVHGIPQVFVIGRDGRIVTHYVGTRSEGDLRAALSRAEVAFQTAGTIPSSNSSSHGHGAAAPCVPILLSPRSADAFDNGLIGKSKERTWEFAWTECPDATDYHLYVIGPRAIRPLIDDDNIRINSYRWTSDDGYVAGANLRGWMWKVRAKINGVWGEWSKTGTFNVLPVGSGSGHDGGPSQGAELSAPNTLAPPTDTALYFPRETVLQREAMRESNLWHFGGQHVDVRSDEQR